MNVFFQLFLCLAELSLVDNKVYLNNFGATRCDIGHCTNGVIMESI